MVRYMNFSSHELHASLVISISALIVAFARAIADYDKPTIINIDKNKIEIFRSIIPIMGTFSTIAGGILIADYGPKKIVYCQSYGFFISFYILAAATTTIELLIGRIISGVCIGIAVLGIPLYLIESLDTPSRGMLSMLPIIITELIKTFVYILYTLSMSWNIMPYLGCLLCGMSLLMLIYIPESPRWYIAHKNNQQLRKAEFSLVWLRSNITDAEYEFREILAIDDFRRTSGDTLFDGLVKVIKLTTCAICLMLLQQLLKLSQYQRIPGLSSNYRPIIDSSIGFIGSILCMIFIERLGRKTLLALSYGFTSVSIIIYIQLHYLYTFNYIDSALMITITYVVNSLSISVGLNSIPWILMAEMIPINYRYILCSLAVSANFIGEIIMINIITLNQHMQIFWIHNTLLYLTILGGAWFILLFIPETTNKTLEEMEFKLMYSRDL